MRSPQKTLLPLPFLGAFILVTSCFALWGFANDITNPMVKAFGRIYQLSATESSLVQFAFYGGYFVMALPAALLNKRTSYRTGIILGLSLYSVGALLFYPCLLFGNYFCFLIAYFILTCGLSFLETSANPYILTLGEPETATQRLNLAQAFNPLGSLIGMLVAIEFIQKRLSPLSTEARRHLPSQEALNVQQHDLSILSRPYILLGIILLIVLGLFLFQKLPAPRPTSKTTKKEKSTLSSFQYLWTNKRYRYGVIAQFFYVGAQIMLWTFIIQYGVRLFCQEGMPEYLAEITAQKYNLLSMILFCTFRFLGAFLLRKVRSGAYLLQLFSIGAIFFSCIAILSNSYLGLICIVLTSSMMSIMFPTIYGQALSDVPKETEYGAAGLIMAILGGSLLPPIQAMIIDVESIWGHPAVNVSFIVPLFSFIVIAIYASYLRRIHS